MKISRFLTYYFILSYFFSWIVFILLALNRHGKIFLFSDDAAHARLADFFHAFGALGPAIAAIVILTLFCNKEQRQFYYSSFSPIGLSFTAWFVSLSPVLYLFLAILISKVITGEWFSIAAFFKQNNLLEPVNFFMWLFPSITYGIFEEMGWRGFALPLLQKKYSAFISSTIITVFWIGWHVPSFWYRYNLNFGSFIGLALGIWAGAILLTYLYNSSRGSLFAVCVWHLSWDVVAMIGKEGVIAAIMSTIIMLIAVFILFRYRGRDLSPTEKITFPD